MRDERHIDTIVAVSTSVQQLDLSTTPLWRGVRELLLSDVKREYVLTFSWSTKEHHFASDAFLSHDLGGCQCSPERNDRY